MLHSDMDKSNDFLDKTDISLASKIVPSTSCAPFDMQWSWVGTWSKWVRPDTGYALTSMVRIS